MSDAMTVVPYPDTFRTRVWANKNGWWCTLMGRPRNDAPYWHGGPGKTAGEAFQQALDASRLGFEGEGVRVDPIGGE